LLEKHGWNDRGGALRDKYDFPFQFQNLWYSGFFRSEEAGSRDECHKSVMGELTVHRPRRRARRKPSTASGLAAGPRRDRGGTKNGPNGRLLNDVDLVRVD
jgi:hypothetical protein